MSRQANFLSRHNRKIASWAVFNFALNLMTALKFNHKLKSRRAQINRVINIESFRNRNSNSD